MKIQKINLLASSLIVITVALSSYTFGPGSNSIAATGAPGNISSCANNGVGCHNSNVLNSGSGSVVVSLDGGISTYTPGATYNVTVQGTGSSISKYGFQIVALKTSDDSNVGTFTAGTGSKTVSLSGKTYVEHSTPSSSGSWSFTWQAPSTNEGEIKFYVAGNSAESPTGNLGDFIYTNTLSITAQTTSTIEPTVQKDLIVSPNPSTGHFSVVSTSEIKQINIFDARGSLINTHGNIGEHTSSFNITSSGIYLIQVQTEKSIFTERIVVE